MAAWPSHPPLPSSTTPTGLFCRLPNGARSRLVRVPTMGLVGGHPINYVDTGRDRPLLLVHGLSGSWQNWLETIPFFARDPSGAWRSTCPASASRRCPREQISIKGYGRYARRVLRRGRRRPRSRRRQLDGRIRRRRARQSAPERVARLVLVSGGRHHDRAPAQRACALAHRRVRVPPGRLPTPSWSS